MPRGFRLAGDNELAALRHAISQRGAEVVDTGTPSKAALLHANWKNDEAVEAANARYPLIALCRAHGLPVPIAEHAFHPTRKFRFDFAWPDRRIAVEIDGGIWTQGRHTRGAGYLRDLVKFNAATMLGWRVLKYAPDQLAQAIDDLRIMFAGDAA